MPIKCMPYVYFSFLHQAVISGDTKISTVKAIDDDGLDDGKRRSASAN